MEGPGEGHAAQEAQEERRVAQGGEQSATVADREDEEDDGVSHVFALRIRPDDRTYEHHGGAHGAYEVGQHCAHRQVGKIVPRGRHGVAGYMDAAGDGEQGEEQDYELDVLSARMPGELETIVAESCQEVDEGGHPEDEGDVGLMPIALEPVARRRWVRERWTAA